MCVSAFPANFTGTQICLYEPEEGKRVLFYQNKTENRHKGANAMLLHIDCAKPMTDANFTPTTDFPHILDDMVKAVRPITKGISRGGEDYLIGSAVSVFNVGIYTVVLAESADAIPDALHRVPAEKRPAINRRLFSFYAQAFPGYSVALCCFNGSAKSEPLMFWYEPKNPEIFRLPALDEHTGGIPRPGEYVDVDHWIMASSFKMKFGQPVKYRDIDKIPENVRALLPERVIGREFDGRMPNGDFGVSAQDVENANMTDRILRLPPPRNVLPESIQ